MTVVVSGTLEGFSREEAEDAVRAAGGKPAGSVAGRRTTWWQAPAPAPSWRRPSELGVPVLDADGFRRLLAGDQPAAADEEIT